MASAFPPLAPSGVLPHLASAAGRGAVAQVHNGDIAEEAAAPKRERKLRHIKSAAPRIATRNHLANLGQRFHSVARPKGDLESLGSQTGSQITTSSSRTGLSSARRESRWKSTITGSSSNVSAGLAGEQRPQSSQARPSSAMRTDSMSRRRSISAPGALDIASPGSQIELPRIRNERVSSAMPRISGGGASQYRPNALSLSRPVSATGRSRPSPTSTNQMFQTLLEEEFDEMSEEAFLADMTEEEFEEWIVAQERGDRAKIAALRRLLIIKKLGIDTREQGKDFRSGSIEIPDFHCEHCRNYWLRHHRLPDECPEERKKRLAQEAEERRRLRGSSARNRRRSKGSKVYGDENEHEYEEYVAADGTVQRRRKKRRGSGIDGSSGDVLDGDSAYNVALSGGRKGRSNGLGHGITEEGDENDPDDPATRRSRDGTGGRIGGGKGGSGSGIGGAGGDVFGKDQFIGADGNVYTGGKVDGDFQIGDIPGFGRNRGDGNDLLDSMKSDRNGTSGGSSASFGGSSDGGGGGGGAKGRRRDSGNDDPGLIGGSSKSAGRSGGSGGPNSGGRNGLGADDDTWLNGVDGGVGCGAHHRGSGTGREGFSGSDGEGSYDGVGNGNRSRGSRRYGRNRGGATDGVEGDGEGTTAGGGALKFGRRSRRGSVVDGEDGCLAGNLKSGSVSPDEDGRYGGKGGQFGRRFHTRDDVAAEEGGRREPKYLTCELQLEDIQDRFTRPWSFSYFPGGVDVEGSDTD